MDFKYTIETSYSGKFEVLINGIVIMEKNIDAYDGYGNKLVFGELGREIKLEQIENFINQIKDPSGKELLVLSNSHGGSLIHYKNSSIVFETLNYGDCLTFILPIDSSEQREKIVGEFKKFYTQWSDYIKN